MSHKHELNCPPFDPQHNRIEPTENGPNYGAGIDFDPDVITLPSAITETLAATFKDTMKLLLVIFVVAGLSVVQLARHTGKASKP